MNPLRLPYGLPGVVAILVLTMRLGQAEADSPPAAPTKPGFTGTPLQAQGTWHIHDAHRPRPPVVVPGQCGTDKGPGRTPSDAEVLLGQRPDLSKWEHEDGAAPTWLMKGGVLQTGRGALQTKQVYRDFQLHVEWATPKDVKGDGQARGNSGVFLLGKFEVQVLDSFENETYADGQASALYGQVPPLVNAALPPGRWQTYDIVFRAPRFVDGNKLESPAIVTVLHNGVVTHAGASFFGPTAHKSNPPYTPEDAQGPLRLQDHGNHVLFRNIWIRPLKAYDEP